MSEKSSLSRWKLVVLIIATICVVSLVSLVGWIDIQWTSSHLSDGPHGSANLRYEINVGGLSGISVNTPVTLLLPLPLVEGRPIHPTNKYVGYSGTNAPFGWNRTISGWNCTDVRTGHGQMLAFTSTSSPLQDIYVIFTLNDAVFDIPGVHYPSLTFSPESWDAVPPYADLRKPEFGDAPVLRTDTAPTLFVLPDLTAAENNITFYLLCSVTKPWRVTATNSLSVFHATEMRVSIPSETASGEIPVMPLVPEGSYRHQGETDAGRDCTHLTYFF